MFLSFRRKCYWDGPYTSVSWILGENYGLDANVGPDPDSLWEDVLKASLGTFIVFRHTQLFVNFYRGQTLNVMRQDTHSIMHRKTTYCKCPFSEKEMIQNFEWFWDTLCLKISVNLHLFSLNRCSKLDFLSGVTIICPSNCTIGSRAKNAVIGKLVNKIPITKILGSIFLFLYMK